MHEFAHLVTQLPAGGAIWSFLMFVVVVGVLVFIHEMGHYLAARSVGVQIEAFSIGFGPEMFGWNDAQGTRWKVAMLPLGGYVKMYAMAGEVKPEDIPENRREGAFVFKKVWQRAWVVLAGPLANFVFAIVATAIIFATQGEGLQLAVIGGLQQGMPAAAAGFEAGDQVTAVDGTHISLWDDFAAHVRANGDKPMDVTVQRSGKTMDFKLTPKKGEVKDLLGETHEYYLIGVTPQPGAMLYQRYSAPGALWGGVSYTWNKSVIIVTALWRMATGQMAPDLGGPFTIAKVAGDFGALGIVELVMFMVFISINLGLVNLLPVPVLDGGHLLYFAAEAASGKPLSERTQEWGLRFGLALLGLLMVFVLYKDVLNVVLPYFNITPVKG